MKTIQELTDLGLQAATRFNYCSMSNDGIAQRTSFAKAATIAAAVRDAVLADVDQEIAELKESNADLKRKLAISRSALERILRPHHSRTAATPPSWAIAAEALEATKL